MENRRWFNTVFLFCNGDKPKSEFAENLAIAYNPGICLLALRGIDMSLKINGGKKYEKKRKGFSASACRGFNGWKRAGNSYGGRWREASRRNNERTAVLEWDGRKFKIQNPMSRIS